MISGTGSYPLENLSKENRWVKLADALDWSHIEEEYLSIWQIFEYIEFGCVYRSEKYVWDFLKTILDQWLSPSPMLQDFYRFNVYIFMFTNEIRPYRPLQTDVRYALCRAGGCPRCWSPKISWREMPFQSPSVFYRSLLNLQVGWNRSESEVRVSLQSS